MTNVAEVQNSIKNIISQFIREEIGNKLSHFSTLALESTISNELKKLDALKEQQCLSTPKESVASNSEAS